ncbi:MAG: TIR domain-containing protein [Sandarakinorhabdus sp.]
MPTDYDIAISFAGEDRALAVNIADLLTNEFNLSVFYDDFEQAKLWGTFLPERLLEIYRDKARSCLIIVSQNYKLKRWTTHEWRAAQERALNDLNTEYILLVRLDDTVLDGMFTSVGFIDGRTASPRTIGRLVYEKIGDTASLNGIVRLADQQYREGLVDEALATISKVEYEENLDLLRVKANIYGQKSMYMDAIECWNKILLSRPSDFLAHFHLGIYYYRIGKFEESVRHYEIADGISPNHPTISSDLPLARAKKDCMGNGDN